MKKKSLKEGTKFDLGKLRYDLLACDSLEELVKVITFGSNKYLDRNWEKGIKFGRVFAAAMRHMWAVWNGENIDPETGLLHTAHAECNMHFLTHYLKNPKKYAEFDDRPLEKVKNVKQKKKARKLSTTKKSTTKATASNSRS